MKIPTILKGDDSGSIILVMDQDHDYTGATLVVAYSGVTRKFTGLTPGGSVSLAFTHDETAGFKLGCKPVLMRLIGPSGSVETVENAEMKIKVTDCLGEVNAGGSFVIKPGTQTGSVPVTDLGDIPNTANVGELYAKVNEIVRVLAQRSLLVLAVCLGLTVSATVHTTTLDKLIPSSVVVTNVAGSSAVDTNAVIDITTPMIASATNAVPRIVMGDLEVRADLTAKVQSGLTQWEPGETGSGSSRYYNVRWADVFVHWICSSSTEEIVQMEGSQVGTSDATELKFPDGTVTHRVPATAEKTIATVDQLPASFQLLTPAQAAEIAKVKDKADEFTVWSFASELSQLSLEWNGFLWELYYETSFLASARLPYDATVIGPDDWEPSIDETATRKRVLRTGDVPSTPYLRVWDEQSQCWWKGVMRGGVLNWDVEEGN